MNLTGILSDFSNFAGALLNWRKPHDDIRQVALEKWRLLIVIQHSGFPVDERVEHEDTRRETLLVSACVSYTDKGSDLDQNWNYAKLVDWLKANENRVQTKPIEALADEILAVVRQSTRAGMDVRDINVKIERPDLLHDYGANVVIARNFVPKRAMQRHKPRTAAPAA